MQNQNCSFDIDNYDIQKRLEYCRILAVDRKTNKEVEIIFEEKHQNGEFPQIRKGLIYNNMFISQYLNLPGIVKLIDYRLPLKAGEKDSKCEKKGINSSGLVLVFEHMKYTDVRRLLVSYISN